MENQKTTDITGKPKIDINDPNDLLYWADKFDVTKVRLKAAINAAGTSAKDVEAYLKKK